MDALASTDTLARTSGGSTLSRYSRDWASNISHDGMETTRPLIPSVEISAAANWTSDSSDPVPTHHVRLFASCRDDVPAPGECYVTISLDWRERLPAQHEHHWAVVWHGKPPRLKRLVRVCWPYDREAGDRPQAHQLGDRLMRRAVLAESNRVVRIDEYRMQPTHRSQPQGRGACNPRRSGKCLCKESARRVPPSRWRSLPSSVRARRSACCARGRSRPGKSLDPAHVCCWTALDRLSRRSGCPRDSLKQPAPDRIPLVTLSVLQMRPGVRPTRRPSRTEVRQRGHT